MDRTIPYAQWEAILRKGAAHFDLSPTDQQIRLFHRHAALLLQWNRKINLTAIEDPLEVAVKHFVDAFGPVSLLAPMRRVLDVGSGGGFPGLPLKVWSPMIDLTLVEAVRKKASFLQHVVRELQLSDARVFNERVETLSRRCDRPLFDTIVCRAFSNLAFIISYTAPLLSEDGKIVVWKGRVPEQETRDAAALLRKANSALTLSLKSYRLPIFEAQRTLVIVSVPRPST